MNTLRNLVAGVAEIFSKSSSSSWSMKSGISSPSSSDSNSEAVTDYRQTDSADVVTCSQNLTRLGIWERLGRSVIRGLDRHNNATPEELIMIDEILKR